MTREEAIEILYSIDNADEMDEEFAEAYNMAIEALEQEPTTKNDLGVDCISRIETIDYLCKHCPDDGECFKDCDEIKHLRQMPPATPIRPKGHWITRPHVYGVTYCSECDFELKIDDTKYCPNCGAKMESEDV